MPKHATQSKPKPKTHRMPSGRVMRGARHTPKKRKGY